LAGLLTLDDGTHCYEPRELAEGKFADVRKKLKDLWRIESVLAALVRNCMSHGKVLSPVIATMLKQ
jgi:MerR family mercuric resistance operon transcriptional regulator